MSVSEAVPAVPSVEIKDVRAVRSGSVPIEAGTVVELRGPNGSGKSTTLKAIEAGISGKGNGLLPTDGKESGTVRVPGVVVRIGARTTSRGKAEHNWVAVDETAGIAAFVDPGVKEAVAADRKRIEQLIEMTGSGNAEAAIRKYLGDLFPALEGAVQGLFRLSLVDAVAGLKRVLETRARESEGTLEQLTGEIRGIGECDMPVNVRTPGEIRDILEKVNAKSEDVVRLRAAKNVSDQAMKDLEELGSDLPDVLQCEKDLLDVGHKLDKCDDEIESLQKYMNELQSKLHVAKNEHAKLEGEQKHLASRRDDAKKAHERHAAATAKIAGRVTVLDISAAEADRTALQEEYSTAVRVAEMAVAAEKSRGRLAALKGQRETVEANAEKFRTLAKTTPEILQAAVGEVGGFSVNEEYRLCIEHKRGVIPFAELSPGERTIAAIEVVMRGLAVADGMVPVLGLRQECWEILSGNNRRAVVEYAKTKGICIVTAAPSEDDRESGIEVHVLRA